MFHSTYVTWALVIGVAGAVFAADAAPAPSAVREIDIKGVKLVTEQGKPMAAAAIMSAEELAKVVPDAEAQAKIKTGVDFAKEKLVLYVWSGSGQDRMTAAETKVGGKVEVVFTFAPGRTRDLRPHQHLFAVPADSQYSLSWEKGR